MKNYLKDVSVPLPLASFLNEVQKIAGQLNDYYGDTIVCRCCGFRGAPYQFRPAKTYPGTMRCPECESDDTERAAENGS